MRYDEVQEYLKEDDHRYGIFTVVDRVSETSAPAWAARNIGVAMRMFRSMVTDMPPEDFRLVMVGAYDLQSMRLVGLDVPEIIEVKV